MRISRHDLRRRYSNLLVIDAGSQFSLRVESLFAGYVRMCNWRSETGDDIFSRGPGEVPVGKSVSL